MSPLEKSSAAGGPCALFLTNAFALCLMPARCCIEVLPMSAHLVYVVCHACAVLYLLPFLFVVYRCLLDMRCMAEVLTSDACAWIGKMQVQLLDGFDLCR